MKIIFTFFILNLIRVTDIYPQQQDSLNSLSSSGKEAYIPLSLIFTDLAMNSNNRMSASDSSSSKKWIPSEEKPGFFKDYIYIIGTAAVAAIIYFLWPEDNPTANKKLTFGPPPPPK